MPCNAPRPRREIGEEFGARCQPLRVIEVTIDCDPAACMTPNDHLRERVAKRIGSEQAS